MLVQNAITPIVFRYATTGAREEDRFSTVVSIGCQEGLKLVMSLGLVILEHGGLRGTFKALLAIEFGDSIRLAVPALLFVFQNA
ncbi:unnamed protein product, partial [Symbiodinium necroappetens]